MQFRRENNICLHDENLYIDSPCISHHAQTYFHIISDSLALIKFLLSSMKKSILHDLIWSPELDDHLKPVPYVNIKLCTYVVIDIKGWVTPP